MIKRVFLQLYIILMVIILCTVCIYAEQSVFGVSEDLLRSFEERRAFEQFLTTNNYELITKFPFLQYDLLPVVLDAHYSPIYDASAKQVYLAPLKQNNQVQETAKGKVLGQYNLFSTELMNLVLYQNDETMKNNLLSSQIGEYTIEAQSMVVNGFKIFYGYDANDSKNEPTGQKVDSSLLTQNAGVEFRVIPGMSLNADYKKTIKGTGLDEAYKHLNLAYEPVSFASFRAGYGIISKNSNHTDSIILLDDTEEDYSNLEDVIIKQLGLSLHPTNYSQLSASYVFVNERGEPISSSKAIFGFRLGDNVKELNATYQMENEVNQKTTTSAGLELGLMDLASVSAVYSKIEDRQLLMRSPYSMVDLGLNLSLANNSSFHFQYKLVLPEDNPEDYSDEEQMAEAKLVFSF